MINMVNALYVAIAMVMMSGPAFASAGCNPIPVPEPSSLTLLAAGLAAAGVGLFVQKRFRRSGRVAGLVCFVAAAAVLWATMGTALAIPVSC